MHSYIPQGPGTSLSDGHGGEFVLPVNGLLGPFRTSDSDGPGASRHTFFDRVHDPNV